MSSWAKSSLEKVALKNEKVFCVLGYISCSKCFTV